MRFITFYLLTLLMTILLAGCGDTYNEIKQAAAGINSKADEATAAISADVHAIRATTVSYKEQTFTVNDVFKTILRDIQWFYDEETNQLKITGTWQDNGLFSEQSFDEQLKKSLQHEGEVEIILVIKNEQIITEHTNVTLTLQRNNLLHLTGAAALYHLYDVYLAQ